MHLEQINVHVSQAARIDLRRVLKNRYRQTQGSREVIKMKGIRNRSYEENLDKRVKNARRICIGICILAALFIFRWQIAKAVFGVDSFSIDTSEISSDEYENAAAVLEKRVRTLSGGAYTRIDHGDRITFEVPSGLFLGKDPYTVIGQEICAEKIMMMGLKEKDGDDLCSLLSLSGEEDVDRVIPLPGAVVLTLTGKSQNDLKEYTSDGEKLDCVVFDVDSDHEKRYPAMSFCGKYIVVPLIAEDPGLPASLQKMQFTEAPVYADLDYCCDNLSGRIDWENPYKNDFTGGGYNQTEFEYLFIDGNVNCISYVEDLYLREMGMEDEEGDTVETREVIRNRLDMSRQTAERYALKLQLKGPEGKLREGIHFLAQTSEKMDSLMDMRLKDASVELERRQTALGQGIAGKLISAQHRASLLEGRLEALSPQAKLDAGFAYVEGPDGKGIRSVSGISPGDLMTVRLRDGSVKTRAEEVRSQYGQG